MEDAYYEEQVKAVIDNMLLQVHMLGEGYVLLYIVLHFYCHQFPQSYSITLNVRIQKALE